MTGKYHYLENRKADKINFINWVPHLLTALAIIIGFNQYNKTTEKEIRKEFFYKQVSSYEKLTNKVAVIIYNQTLSKDSLQFLLYDYKKFRHGEYALYTTDSVEKYAITFEYYYDRYIKRDSITNTDLENIAFKLYNQCRLSLNQTLDVNLKQIQFRNSLK